MCEGTIRYPGNAPKPRELLVFTAKGKRLIGTAAARKSSDSSTVKLALYRIRAISHHSLRQSKERKGPMAGALKELIEATKAVTPTREQREEQRRSFAFGNTAFENSRNTRAMVDRQAELLAKEQNGA
jgi:hypothetical protein